MRGSDDQLAALSLSVGILKCTMQRRLRGRTLGSLRPSGIGRPRARLRYFDPGSEITPRATSLFQMNSTISAPMVDVMNPAP